MLSGERKGLRFHQTPIRKKGDASHSSVASTERKRSHLLLTVTVSYSSFSSSLFLLSPFFFFILSRFLPFFLLDLSHLPLANCSRSFLHAWLHVLSPRHLLHKATLLFSSQATVNGSRCSRTETSSRSPRPPTKAATKIPCSRSETENDVIRCCSETISPSREHWSVLQVATVTSNSTAMEARVQNFFFIITILNLIINEAEQDGKRHNFPHLHFGPGSDGFEHTHKLSLHTSSTIGILLCHHGPERSFFFV